MAAEQRISAPQERFCQGAQNGYNEAAIRLGVAGDQAGDLNGCSIAYSALA